jgi:hypothetical protein
VLVQGPTAALRSRPLWIALGVFVALHQGVSFWCRAATGFAPYAHYGVLLETTAAGQAALFQKEWIGWPRYLAEHRAEVAAILAFNARTTARLLFTAPDFHYVGWLAVPALVDAWRRRDAERTRRLLVAVLGVALLAVHLVSWGAVDPRRLLIPAAFCFWVLAAAWLANAAGRAKLGFGFRRRERSERAEWRRSRPPAWAAIAPVALVAAAWLTSPSAAGTTRQAREAWNSFRTRGVQTGLESSFAPAFCAALDRDAIVATTEPWELYLACGNATWWLPPDVDEPDVLARYLDAAAPGQLIVPLARARRFEASPRLERGRSAGGQVLFTLRDAPARSRPWRAPPPLLPVPPATPSPARTP